MSGSDGETGARAGRDELRTRFEQDRLFRFGVLAPLPALWLALALADPWLLLLAPLAVGLLVVLFRYGPFERFEPRDELY